MEVCEAGQYKKNLELSILLLIFGTEMCTENYIIEKKKNINLDCKWQLITQLVSEKQYGGRLRQTGGCCSQENRQLYCLAPAHCYAGM